MNEQRRKQIAEAQAKIEEAKSIIETCAEEEREYYDNMPENMQSGEKGDAATQAGDELDEALNACEEALAHCETASE